MKVLEGAFYKEYPSMKIVNISVHRYQNLRTPEMMEPGAPWDPGRHLANMIAAVLQWTKTLILSSRVSGLVAALGNTEILLVGLNF